MSEKYVCRICKENVERENRMYNIPVLQDPLWLHLKNGDEKHKEYYKLMDDFANPYCIEDVYLK